MRSIISQAQPDIATDALPGIIALLLYDYVITLPLEIRYIWNDHFKLVGALYLLNRYTTLLGYIPYMVFQFDSPRNETVRTFSIMLNLR